MLSKKVIQRQQQMQQLKNQTRKIQSITNFNQISASNQTVQCFAIRLQNGIQQQGQTTVDYTIAWQYQIPVLKPQQNALILQTEVFSTTIHDYVGDNYPQTISIGIRGFNGYIGSNGLPTSRVIVLNLSNISTVTINGMVSRDLIYTSTPGTSWQLGTMRNLIMECFVDEMTNPISFPINNPISITFKIIHMSI